MTSTGKCRNLGKIVEIVTSITAAKKPLNKFHVECAATAATSPRRAKRGLNRKNEIAALTRHWLNAINSTDLKRSGSRLPSRRVRI